MSMNACCTLKLPSFDEVFIEERVLLPVVQSLVYYIKVFVYLCVVLHSIRESSTQRHHETFINMCRAHCTAVTAKDNTYRD